MLFSNAGFPDVAYAADCFMCAADGRLRQRILQWLNKKKYGVKIFMLKKMGIFINVVLFYFIVWY